MTPRRARGLAWGSFATGLVLAIVASVMFEVAGPISPDAPPTDVSASGGLLAGIVSIAPFVAFGLVGAVIASRRPDNTIGWLFCGAGLVTAVTSLFGAYGYWGILAHPGSLPGARLAEWASDTLYTPTIPLTTTFLFLLFPDGRLPSRRWRWAFWLTVSGAALGTIGGAVAPTLYGLDTVANPVVAIPEAAAGWIGGIGFLAVMVSLVASVASLVVRFRRSRGEVRQQLKWFAFAAMFTLLFAVPSIASDNPPPVLILAGVIAALLIPVSVVISILKYRLYDIDVVISKALMFGALAAFITVVYVAIVVGLGSLIGAQSNSVFLSILATAIVAIAFQQVRERVQRIANRVVYGERATPYEVLARFSDRVAGTYATEDVLPRTARVIAEGTGAAEAAVWLRIGDGFRRSASWPASNGDVAVVPAQGEDLPAFDADRAVAVRNRDELLGAITVTKARGEPLAPAEERLMDDLASQAGLVLSNVRLTAELEARLEQIASQAAELRASRQRIVAAQDDERRRLERNIHDGAQQHLVALAVKLRLAKGFLGKDAARAQDLLGELNDEVGEALDTLTSLSLGIYPPLLEEQGLAAALASQYQRSHLPVHMEVDGTARYPIEAEAAVYFCVLEALQNAAKHAHASSVGVRVGRRDGGLGFEVTDDGAGFGGAAPRGSGLQNMADRLSALGGRFDVTSEPGNGTTVTGWVPVFAMEGAR